MADDALRTKCSSCGADIPPWFDEEETVYDLAKDDAAFGRWMMTPCPKCGLTPAQVLEASRPKP